MIKVFSEILIPFKKCHNSHGIIQVGWTIWTNQRLQHVAFINIHCQGCRHILRACKKIAAYDCKARLGWILISKALWFFCRWWHCGAPFFWGGWGRLDETSSFSKFLELCPCFAPKGIRTGKKGHDPMSLSTKTSTTSSVSDGSGTGSVACGKKMDLYRLNASSNWIACVTALKPELDPLVTHFTPFVITSLVLYLWTCTDPCNETKTAMTSLVSWHLSNGHEALSQRNVNCLQARNRSCVGSKQL